MSERAAAAQLPLWNPAKDGPALDILPPKQRFKEAIEHSNTVLSRQKRPLAEHLPEGRAEGTPFYEYPTDRAATGHDATATDDSVEAAKQSGKLPRIQPSLIRNIAPFRKPRVGLEYQATIPALMPKPRPSQ